MIEIDGSYGSGGGAILRVASTLSAITGKPICVKKIRAKRKNPGLKIQHLKGLKAIANLCSGKLKGAELGSTDIELYPGKLQPRQLDVKIPTAGSIGLLFQSLKLPASRATKEITINVDGGADFGKFAPPLAYTQNVLLPVLKKMGYMADIKIIRHGFYPKGGAKVNIVVQSCPILKPLTLTERGKILNIQGISIAAKYLEKRQVASRQAAEAKKLILEKTGLDPKIKTEYVDSACPGSGIVLWALTDTGCILGADGLGELGKTSEQVGQEAAKSLIKTLESEATVDPNLSDQLLIFMALAKGKSAIVAPEITLHAKTNIWVIQKFLPVKFEVKKNPKNVIIYL